jgi:hypothetical protein
MTRENPLDEDAPNRISTAKRRRFGYDAKQPDEPYRAARRYLESRVGDKWDDVWADICNAPKDKKEILNLIKKNPDSFVYLKCYKKDDGIYTCVSYLGEYRVDKEVINNYSYFDKMLYVFDGILKKKNVERKVSPKEQKVIKFNESEYVQKDGIWYKVILKDITYPWYIGSSCDTLRKYRFTFTDGYKFYGRSVYCSEHFPLKEKELKALKDFIKKNNN